MKITFIGLGIMGSRMASNLLKNGVELTVYNRSKESERVLEKEGANAADSLRNAVKDADVVFSMLSTPEVVEKLFFGKDAVLSVMKEGSIWADCTTVNPSFSLRANEEAKKHQVIFCDTPVAGSKPQAENAELSFFVGSDPKTLEILQPYLEMMGNKTMHLGEVGKGASFKMLINMMLAQSMVVFSEALLLGEKMGIDKEFLLNSLPKSPVIAPFTQFKAEMIRNDDYEVNFPLEWMHKDLHLAAQTALEYNVPLPLSHTAKEIYANAKNAGYGRLDFAAVYKYLESK